MPRISIELDSIRCNKPTDTGLGRDRDELYWIISGGAPNGDLHTKRPRSSTGYWGFFEDTEMNGRTLLTAAEAMDRVRQAHLARRYRRLASQLKIWEGAVDRTDQVALSITFAEQDNDVFGWLVNLWREIEGSGYGDAMDNRASFSELPITAGEAQAAAAEMRQKVQEGYRIVKRILSSTDHDRIGGFGVSVNYINNNLSVNWDPLDYTTLGRRTNTTAVFNMNNPEHDSSYVVQVSVKTL